MDFPVTARERILQAYNRSLSESTGRRAFKLAGIEDASTTDMAVALKGWDALRCFSVDAIACGINQFLVARGDRIGRSGTHTYKGTASGGPAKQAKRKLA